MGDISLVLQAQSEGSQKNRLQLTGRSPVPTIPGGSDDEALVQVVGVAEEDVAQGGGFLDDIQHFPGKRRFRGL